MRKNVMTVMIVVAGLVVVSGCINLAREGTAMRYGGTNVTGTRYQMEPDSDGNVMANSAGAGMIDNLDGLDSLVKELVGSGVDPSALLEIAQGDPEEAAEAAEELIAKADEAGKSEAAKRLVGMIAATSGLQNITGNTVSWSKPVSADVASQISDALRAVTQASQKEAQQDADGDASGETDVSPSLDVTP